MRPKRVWVSPRFHKALKRRANDEDMSIIDFTENIILKGNDPFNLRGKNATTKKKKYVFSI